jgi:L-ascorbate metabolism protein UlaG (beta-lactamase superfamily)
MIAGAGKKLAIDIGTMTPIETVKAMPAPDAILVSRRHGDRFGRDHPKTFGAPIVAPGDVLDLLHGGANATAVRAGQTLDVAGFTVAAVEPDHGQKLSAPIENLGFVIQFPGGGHTLRFGGDIARPGTPAASRLDIVVPPVGGAGFVFDPAEAVACLERMDHRGRVIPVHDSGPCDPDAVARFADLAPPHFGVIELSPGEKVEVQA